MFTKDQLWGSNGHAKTSSLFTETSRQGDSPVMTLRGGREDLPCLRDLYVPLCVNDPTETTFAEAVFGDVRYWLKLREAGFMTEFLEEWREICDTKRKQLAFKAIIDEIETKGRSAFTAAKYLIEEPWKGQSKTVKEKVDKTTKKAISVFDEDLSRLKEEGYFQ